MRMRKKWTGQWQEHEGLAEDGEKNNKQAVISVRFSKKNSDFNKKTKKYQY